METIKKNANFIKDIIDGMFDWVRVLDKDDNIVYMNKSMQQGMKTAVIGSKCYIAVGRTEPCENCISRKAVFDGDSHEKEELVGDRIFSVMSSPVKNENGEIVAVVEVLRDMTKVKQLQREIVKQNTKLRDDLSMARRLQCSMLPKHLPEDCIDFSFIYNPCEALGGDFLDIFRIDDSHIGLYIADVSGHGVPASLLTVFLRSTLDKKLLSPAEALKALYKEFNASNFEGDLYITLFYSIIDLVSKTMVYANAGHNVCPILISNKDKERFKPIRLPGIPISHWVEDPGYMDESIKLKVNDRLFLYTDGIIEMKNSRNEQFGEDRLLQLLDSKKDTAGTLNSIFTAACEFAGLTDLTKALDDITIALLEIKY